MCGFAGLITRRAHRADELRAIAQSMVAPISHRGPDDDGAWVDAESGVALGFRRLAIVDLSPNGHQPMHSGSGRFVIVFNGEIYNHEPLRHTLRSLGHRFQGTSDTEVALAAFEEWGIAASLRLFVGMFAMAVWDARDRALSLARDRVGKKPLFYAAQPGLVTFGSELKALKAGPRFDDSIDRDALASYFRYLYVPGPRSIFSGVRKLEPGHLLTIPDADSPTPASVPFWSLGDAVAQGQSARPFNGSERDAIDAVEATLREAVTARMCADVPLGAFLSGGVDSSTVVSLMQAASATPINTFSVGFDSAEHNEAHHAALLARHLRTNHTEVMLTGHDALEVVPRLATIYDEPFADASQIPTYLICREARRHVTVVLSGDGGDEVFGGYNRYVYGEQMVTRLGRVPRFARHLVGAGIASVGTQNWDFAYRTVAPVLPRALRHRLPGQKLHRLARLMRQGSEAAMYRSLVSQWPNPERLVRGSREGADAVDHAIGAVVPRGLLSRMMFADQSSYLVEDQMTKIDRASMSVSLEVRAPILDHRVIELAWRLPETLKVRDGVGKWVLKQVLYRHVPRALVDREKMGFSVPVGVWLRGPLRDWAESLLASATSGGDELLAPAPILQAWRRLTRGDEHPALSIWAVLMFQQWRTRWAS
jgi:asparagine synthase (glutamine-hydrolysing)